MEIAVLEMTNLNPTADARPSPGGTACKSFPPSCWTGRIRMRRALVLDELRGQRRCAVLGVSTVNPTHIFLSTVGTGEDLSREQVTHLYPRLYLLYHCCAVNLLHAYLNPLIKVTLLLDEIWSSYQVPPSRSRHPDKVVTA
jgi:hypothetical protein